MPKILERIEKVRDVRLQSSRPMLADRASVFAQVTCDPYDCESAIAIPRISSERRSYIPMAFLDNSVVVTDLLQMIPGGTKYEFGVLMSQMHMAWVRAVCGRLKSDYRYSKDIVYNNFPWPEPVREAQRAEIERLAHGVLDARTAVAGATLADLYDPLTMPPELLRAHKALDRAVDRLYRKEPFADDAERVGMLFGRYGELTNAVRRT